MHKLLAFSLLVMGCCWCGHLSSGPDPLELNEAPVNKGVSKRYIPWLFPSLYSAPQIVEVHHIVYLQPPDRRCFPQVPGPTGNPPGAGENDLEGRFGQTNRTSSSTEPSRCVWAIVSCCAPGSRNIRYTCFELLGCQGAFWDRNPCEASVVMAAANTALKFYMSNLPSQPTNNDLSTNTTK